MQFTLALEYTLWPIANEAPTEPPTHCPIYSEQYPPVTPPNTLNAVTALVGLAVVSVVMVIGFELSFAALVGT